MCQHDCIFIEVLSTKGITIGVVERHWAESKDLGTQSMEILLSILDGCKQSNESCSKLRFSKGQWACLSLHNLLKIKSGVTGTVI